MSLAPELRPAPKTATLALALEALAQRLDASSEEAGMLTFAAAAAEVRTLLEDAADALAAVAVGQAEILFLDNDTRSAVKTLAQRNAQRQPHQCFRCRVCGTVLLLGLKHNDDCDPAERGRVPGECPECGEPIGPCA